jgi:ferredoxin
MHAPPRNHAGRGGGVRAIVLQLDCSKSKKQQQQQQQQQGIVGSVRATRACTVCVRACVRACPPALLVCSDDRDGADRSGHQVMVACMHAAHAQLPII